MIPIIGLKHYCFEMGGWGRGGWRNGFCYGLHVPLVWTKLCIHWDCFTDFFHENHFFYLICHYQMIIIWEYVLQAMRGLVLCLYTTLVLLPQEGQNGLCAPGTDPFLATIQDYSSTAGTCQLQTLTVGCLNPSIRLLMQSVTTLYSHIV